MLEILNKIYTVFIGWNLLIFFIVMLFFVSLIIVLFIVSPDNKINILIKVSIGMVILVTLFYTLFPILENKRIVLSRNFYIKKEPHGVYRAYIKDIHEEIRLLIYVEILMKEEENWIGYIYNCTEIIKNDIPYQNLYPFYSSDELDGRICSVLQKYSGIFILDEEGGLEYGLKEEEIKRKFGLTKMKFKGTGYFMQRYGLDKNTSERYFSADESIRIFQDNLVVRKRAFLIRSHTYIILFFILIILLFMKFLKYYHNKK